MRRGTRRAAGAASHGAQGTARSGGMSEAAEAPYEMVNLVPRITGLPMTVWASPRGQARHDVRIKINPTHGRQMIIRDAVSVARWHLDPRGLGGGTAANCASAPPATRRSRPARPTRPGSGSASASSIPISTTRP